MELENWLQLSGMPTDGFGMVSIRGLYFFKQIYLPFPGLETNLKLNIGYEVCGLENIPNDTPALIIYYHGAVPVDVYYFLSKVMLFKNRMVHTVADRFLFKIPGL